MAKYYTGIGSRVTPAVICEKMTQIAQQFELEGYTLRSGAADGADTAFEAGSVTKNIFLPWNNFNGKRHDGTSYILVHDPEILDSAERLVQRLHPKFSKLTVGAKKLHIRNCFQILGPTLTVPSDIVIYWAIPDNAGNPVGGTATAVKLAKMYDIKTVNLFQDSATRNY